MAASASTISALLDLLGEQNSHRGRDVLTVAPALEELAATLEDTINGRSPMFTDDRGSLVADVELALTRVGEYLDRHTTPPLRELRTTEVSRLAATLADLGECRRLLAVVNDVLGQLRDSEAVRAAWNDVVGAAGDGGVSVESCALAADQLRELVRLRGHQWWYIGMAVSAAVREGDLEAAYRAAAEPPLDDATVVWLAFGNADLGRGYYRVGPVQFFTHRLTLENIRDGCPALNTAEFEPAAELTDEVLTSFPAVEDEEHYVWARVELVGPRAAQPEGGRRLPPVDWARQFVQGLVEAATFPVGGTEWELLDGGYAFTASSGPGGGSMSFRAPSRERDTFFGRPLNEPTAGQLDDLPDGFANALARGEPAARFAVDGVRWHRAVRVGTDPLGRIALYVRVFERHWVTGRAARFGTWEEPTRYFLRDVWAHAEVQRGLKAGGRAICARARGHDGTQRLTAAASKVEQSTGSVSFVTVLPAVIEHAPRVASDFPAGTIGRRLLKRVVRGTRDGDALRDWWQEGRRRFDILLNRAVRQRNGIIHGRTTNDAVAESIEPFLRQLSAWLVTAAVDAAVKGESVSDAVADMRASRAARYSQLEGAPTESFFSPFPSRQPRPGKASELSGPLRLGALHDN